mmetsp:Transcript_43333/g.97945  ORF Transcript_43333/g.97945 Transcript_43333/m.97945 type:complete len:260 (+) Transcript_43333:81-860(+)
MNAMMVLRALALVNVASALVAPPSLFRPRTSPMARRRSQLSMIDASLMETVTGGLAVPGVLVGTGTFLLTNVDIMNTENSQELAGLLNQEGESRDKEDGEVDIYRDTLLRYAGYANEVGEAFAPIVPAAVVPASYAVAITYVLADTVDKTKKAFSGGKYEEIAKNNCALIEGFDALIWQLAASVALPGYTIHQIVLVTVAILGSLGLTEGLFEYLPTAVGLLTIPFIVKPLDELAEVGMDVTLRKLWNPYLESCEVTYD